MPERIPAPWRRGPPLELRRRQEGDDLADRAVDGGQLVDLPRLGAEEGDQAALVLRYYDCRLQVGAALYLQPAASATSRSRIRSQSGRNGRTPSSTIAKRTTACSETHPPGMWRRASIATEPAPPAMWRWGNGT